ncbi:MAG TPA: hypothetical protein DCM71_05305 [Runella sp.]|nr:hypothetical protein [Runella sp.]
MNSGQFERIEAYLQNQLSEAERRDFESELQYNSAFRLEVETQQKLYIGFQALAIEKRLNASKKRTQIQQRIKPKQPFSVFKQWPVWSAAASVVLIIGISWWMAKSFGSSRETEIVALVDREMTDVQYKSLPFESLQNISKTAPSRLTREKAEWYVALVYLKKGKTKEANKILARIAHNPKHHYHLRAKKIVQSM